MTDQNNPLHRHFRKPKLYVSLPSQGKYYKNDEVDLSISSELPILPMTSRDEMMLKNPDALLNGEAIIEIMKSCCTSIKKPLKILKNDVDVIMLAVRSASYGDELEVQITCPSCQHQNDLALSIAGLLNQMTFLEGEYSVETGDGLKVYVTPFTFEAKIRAMLASFEESKIIRTLQQQGLTEHDRIKAFSGSFKKLAELNFNLIADCVQKVHDLSEDVMVEKREHIVEFLSNIDNKTVSDIEKKVAEINEIGVPNKVDVECQNCSHKWNTDLELDPVNFFTGS